MDVQFDKMLAGVPGSQKELKILLLPFTHEKENCQYKSPRTIPIIDILSVIFINYLQTVKKKVLNKSNKVK